MQCVAWIRGSSAAIQVHAWHHESEKKRKKREKRKDYAFRRQFNEKPSIIPGCPAHECDINLSQAALKRDIQDGGLPAVAADMQWV